MKYSLVGLLLLILVSASVTGFAAERGSLIAGTFDATSREERLEVARDVLDHVEQLSDYVTTPKPSDVDWVIAEQEAITKLEGTDSYYERLKLLVLSAEFQGRNLERQLDNIEDALKCVINDEIKIEREILCWSVASLMLSDENTLDDAIMILVRHDRLPKDIARKASLGTSYSEHYDWWGRGIFEYIVIPYLQGTITE